ncbi:hypothetical protein MTR67_012832 [Solanum verrucosum]|uniref:NB-ARC domain-containing protein n=1 Tax=Solanum verrucosum TaxID=315347 RepID=A0AAF0TGB5_SOLVR|nr:hypothetical protein MTR67_012832 [Solanum verrucosum]
MVDQGYAEKKLLDKIFNQVSDSNSKLSENIDVVDKLRKQLYGKRYLIVLDDVWDTTTWDELTIPFPEVEKGSRIILTTQKKEVALHGKLCTAPLKLRLLRSEESWELLEKRAFGNESCPDELLYVGKEIAKNCKGLPLVADLIAGVIVGREKKRTAWLEVQNNLSSFILNSEIEVMKVIELSYDHLPHHLKPCLLYLTSCPKDTALTISLLKVEVGEESFPALEKLKLEGCCDLEEIPPSFGDIYSLKIITLVYNPQLEDSAMKIKEYAEDMQGGDEL